MTHGQLVAAHWKSPKRRGRHLKAMITARFETVSIDAKHMSETCLHGIEVNPAGR